MLISWGDQENEDTRGGQVPQKKGAAPGTGAPKTEINNKSKFV